MTEGMLKFTVILIILFSVTSGLSAQNAFYPVQKTTWYFKTKYEKSPSNSDQNELKVTFGKQKTDYKIIFVDDESFLVTYTDKRGQSYINSGKYNIEGNMIDFRYDRTQEIKKDRNGKTIKEIPEPPQVTPRFNDPKDFHDSKGTRGYFQFLFSMSYESVYNKVDDILELNAKVESAEREIMPTLPAGQ